MYRFAVQPSDFLVSCSGVNYGAIFQLPLRIENGVINQALLRIRLNLEIMDEDFFLYFFRHQIVNQIVGKKGDSTIPNFPPVSVLKSLKFKVPNIETQQKIANVLSTLDAKIELNNKINAELEAMAKLVYDYWFVQFDFPTSAAYAASVGKPLLAGQPYKSSGGLMVYNEVLKRDIPEGWEDGTFGDYSKVYSGFAFKSSSWQSNGVPVIKIKDVQEDNTVSISQLSFVSEDYLDSAEDYLSFGNDVVIAMTGATIGKFGIIPENDNGILVNQRVGFYDLGEEPIERLPYLINSLQQKYVRDTIFRVATGAAQPNISNKQLDKIPLVKPPSELLNKFNTDYSSIYKQISNGTKQNQELTSLRDWLLPMLMNGQVTVGDAEEKVAEYGAGESVSLAAEGEGEYGGGNG
jgi:type I restriction enzyme S subunit